MHDAPVLHGADSDVSGTVHFPGRPSAGHPCMEPFADDPELVTRVR